MTPDEQLWHEMRGGSKSALEKIYNREVDYLYQYCCRLTRDHDLVLDCLQDLFIEIWNRRKSIGATNAIRPYLITSLRRKVIHALKKNQGTAGELEEELAFRTEEAVESSIIALETQSEQKDALTKSMEALSKRQREAIYLKYYNNCSYEEICRIMDINYQSVRNLISSGLKKMRGYLDDG